VLRQPVSAPGVAEGKPEAGTAVVAANDAVQVPGAQVTDSPAPNSGAASVPPAPGQPAQPAPALAQPAPPAVAPEHATTTTTPSVLQRKVIRNGEVEFEVEGFDAAFVTISKI